MRLERRADPRQNAPRTISSLPFDDRRQALIDRHKAGEARFMATYRTPARQGIARRLIARVFG